MVIGSQAILGQYPTPPNELTESAEVDVYAPAAPEDSSLIDGSIGEGSPFHQTFGYYAHGVGASTATLPRGWEDRVISIRTPNTGDATGECLEIHDLAISKLVAGRDKDIEYVRALLRHGLASADILRSRLADTPLAEELRALCEARLDRLRR